MCHWKKWIWPGLLTVAILSLLALWWKTDIIQNDLTAKATTALEEQGMGWAKVSLDGRDATITGSAPNQEAQTKAAILTDNAYDVRVVDNKIGLLAAQSPYTLKAVRDGNAVKLTGFVPDEDTRSTILANAKQALPGAEITDELTLARGAPAGLAAIAGFGLSQLSDLTSGEMSLSDTALSVTGAASDFDKFNSVNSALDNALPSGATLAMKDITAPSVAPYTWAADYDGAKVTLSGHVPSVDVGSALAAKATETLPGAEIVDNQIVASGAPNGFQDAAAFSLGQLPRFSNGSVSLSDSNLEVSGVATDGAKYSMAKAAIAGALPAGLALASEKIVPSTVSPYSWGADFDGKQTTLTGYVPNTDTRASLVSAARAKLPGDVVDNMQIAAGAPDGFGAGAAFAIDQLPRFNSGSVSLSDQNLTVKGVAKDAGAYSAATNAVSGTLPDSFNLAMSDISPATVSPYTWGATYDGNVTKLTGFVPDSKTRNSVVAYAKSRTGGTVVDDMQIAAGASDRFRSGTSFALSQLPRFSSGQVDMSDSALSVRGTAKDSKSYTAAKIAVSGKLPAGLTLENENIVAAAVSPYTWSADYDGSTVTLNGFVPDNENRDTIVAAVKSQLPGTNVDDQMQIAAGAPDTFGAATVGAISLLPRFSQGGVYLNDTDLTVKGQAKSAKDFDDVNGTVNGSLTGGMNLQMADIKPAPVVVKKDYVWAAERRRNSIILSGNAPNKKTRKQMGARVKALYPGTTVVNRIIPRADAPAGLLANVDTAIELLDRVSTGNAKIVNSTMSFTGQASSVNNYYAGNDQLAGDLKYGFAWNEREITPATVSPYTWSIVKGADTAEQSGFVPSIGDGNSLLGASRVVLNKEVTDKQRVAAGAPENFSNAAAAAIGAVNELDNSRASITNTNMFVQGRTSSEDEANRLRDQIATSIPANFKVRSQISYPLPKAPEVTACKIDFPALFAGEKIRFATNRALIKEESTGLLNRLAEAALKCPDTRFEVGGHTDSRGRDKYNMQLSEARAQAVVDYLGNAGVASGNLIAKGYGENSPIAENGTVEGRAQNRRIEFTVLGQ